MKSKQQEKYDEPEAASYPNAVPCLSHLSLSLSLSRSPSLFLLIYMEQQKHAELARQIQRTIGCLTTKIAGLYPQ